MKRKPVRVVIDKSQWARGAIGESALLNPGTKKMCCLGFACLAIGIKQEEIADKLMPYAVPPEPGQPSRLANLMFRHGLLDESWYNTLFANWAALFNDSPMSDEERIEKLTRLAQDDRHFEFIFQ